MAMNTSGAELEEFISFGLKTCPQEDCRICLENVGVQPIFGDTRKPDISLEITTFGGVHLSKDDDFPQFICDPCFSLLENAITFRRFAKRTDALLKRRRKRLTQPPVNKHENCTQTEMRNMSMSVESEKLPKSKVDYMSLQSSNVTDLSNISYHKPESSFLNDSSQHGQNQMNHGPHHMTGFQASFEQQIHHNGNMVVLLVSQDDNNHNQLTNLNMPNISSGHMITDARTTSLSNNGNNHMCNIDNQVSNANNTALNIYNPDVNYHNPSTSAVNNEIANDIDSNMSRDNSPIPGDSRAQAESKEGTSNYYCKYCKTNFTTSAEYEEHRNTVEHKRNYVLSFLPKKNTRKPGNPGTTEERKSSRPKDQKCDICFELFTKLQFPKHMLIEHNIKIETTTKRECKICNKLIDRRSLPRHMKRKHEMEKEAEPKVKLECPICKKVFAKQYYPLHMNRHKESENKKYVCDQCGRKFAFKSSFNTHKLVHTNEYPFKCDYCPYQGRTKGLLKIHMRTHTGDYPFKCTQCDTQCLTKSNLNWHMRRHRGPVDFVCGACNRGFYSKLQLERHVAVTHYGQKNHVCTFCGSAFGYRNGLMRHLRKVHKRPKLRLGKQKYNMAELSRLPQDQNIQQKALVPPPMPVPPPPTSSYIVQNFVY